MFGRPWKYDEKKTEYYVIYEDRTAHKKEDSQRQKDETDLGEFWLNHICPTHTTYQDEIVLYIEILFL